MRSHPSPHRRNARRLRLATLAGFAAVLALALSPARLAAQTSEREVTRMVQGSIPVATPMQLRVAAELADVTVTGGPAGAARYTIRLHTRAGSGARARLDAWPVSVRQEGRVIVVATGRGPGAGHTHVEIAITVPPLVRNVRVHSGVGNLRADRLAGALHAVTAAGNIAVDAVQGEVRVETAGGNVILGHLDAGVHATTAGGNITLAAAAGPVQLQSQGGNITIGHTAAAAHVATAGGTISLGSAGGDVIAETAGGNIHLGAVAGSVRAESGGGNIRIARARGIRCRTGGGNIYLTASAGPVRAATGAGSIHATITAAPGRFAASQLQTAAGGIFVYLPPSLPLTVDAVAHAGGRLTSDIPQIASAAASSGGATADVALNGGGPELRISTSNGGIHIRKLNSRPASR